jgi:hypothetical protein
MCQDSAQPAPEHSEAAAAAARRHTTGANYACTHLIRPYVCLCSRTARTHVVYPAPLSAAAASSCYPNSKFIDSVRSWIDAKCAVQIHTRRRDDGECIILRMPSVLYVCIVHME